MTKVNSNQANFFKPSKQDRLNDIKYAKDHNIDITGLKYQDVKAKIIANETGMSEDNAKSFFGSKGAQDHKLDLAALESLGLKDTGSREGNKAAIIKALAEKKASSSSTSTSNA